MWWSVRSVRGRPLVSRPGARPRRVGPRARTSRHPPCRTRGRHVTEEKHMSRSNRKDLAYIPQERAAARAAFRERYGADLRFAPVLVVIAAFNEEDCLGE